MTRPHYQQSADMENEARLADLARQAEADPFATWGRAEGLEETIAQSERTVRRLAWFGVAIACATLACMAWIGWGA
jgi:hypothetical protein